MKLTRLTFLRRLGAFALGPLLISALQVMSAPGSQIEEIRRDRRSVTAVIAGHDCWYDGAAWRWSDSGEVVTPQFAEKAGII